jgi:hypothetical protein
MCYGANVAGIFVKNKKNKKKLISRVGQRNHRFIAGQK